MASLPKRPRITIVNVNDLLVDDVLMKIIHDVPISQWPRLELISKQFQHSVKNMYFSLRSLDLKDVFLADFGRYSKNERKLELILAKLSRYCPRLNTICGFDCVSHRINLNHLELLQNFTELKSISFENCLIFRRGLSDFLKNFSHMQTLVLNGSCISIQQRSCISVSENYPLVKENAEHFDFFENFCGLIDLTLADFFGRLSGCFLSKINADNLRMLNFSNSKFSGGYVCDLLNRCINLESLHLYDPWSCIEKNSRGLELKVLKCLPNLPKLRAFRLDVEDVEKVAFKSYFLHDLLNILVKCKSLRAIHIQHLDFSDESLQLLTIEFPLLETLHLNITGSRSKEIALKIADLENLSSLILHADDYTNNMVKDLYFNLDKLDNLSSLSVMNLGQAELLSLKNLKHLTSFTYSGRLNVTEMVVKNWIAAGFLKNLKILKLPDVADSVVKAISENALVLEVFHVSGEIIDETLVSIAENCKRLKMLDFRSIDVTENGLLKFLSLCSDLQCLEIDGYSGNLEKNASFQPYKRIIRRGLGVFDLVTLS